MARVRVAGSGGRLSDKPDPAPIQPTGEPTGTTSLPTGGMAGWEICLGCLIAAVTATFEVITTSIGWHLASGRWMLEHHRVLDHNPFTFTAEGVAWLDHEWLFQLVVAAIEGFGSAPALVLFRIVVVAGIVLLIHYIGRSSGLAPAQSLLLTTICLLGARMRLFVRPELFTLLLTPLAVYLFLSRRHRSTAVTASAIAAIVVVGINAHAAILVLPFMLVCLAAAETLQGWYRKTFQTKEAITGGAIVAAASVATLFNPWGWHVLAAPFRLAHLVGQPFVPNPEWLSPTPSDLPGLYLAITVSAIVMIIRERDLRRWVLFLLTVFLALRYVRNVGLFYVLLPLCLAPALARIDWFSRKTRRFQLAALAATSLILVMMPNASGFPMGFGFSLQRYPEAACRFLEDCGRLPGKIYNDVRFGGWLVGRYYPRSMAFIDDRNEVHESLLYEIWSIESSSSVARWQSFLEGWNLDTALLRYHQPLEIQSPEGDVLGTRGYSTLWFPPQRWALVYWDDVAMILVDRATANPEWLATTEYRWFRPDDLNHLAAQLHQYREMAPAVEAEIRRKLREDPHCLLALRLAERVSSISSE